MSSSLTLLLVLPSVVLFTWSGEGKLRHASTFRYVVLKLGFRRIATMAAVRALGTLEILFGVLGLATAQLGPIALTPMLTCLAGFTCIVAIRRPSSCGCGVIDMGWRLAATRNLALSTLLLVAIRSYP